MAEHGELLPQDADFTTFVVLGAHRTGSTVLSRALNSHENIRCFGELFNFVLDFIDYQVEGYDVHSAIDKELRDEEPGRFLRERIYGTRPGGTAAIGFKFHYPNFWFNESFWRSLVTETRIRVIHLQRRNYLRRLVSERIALHTGVWQQQVPTTTERASVVAGKLTPAKAVVALTRPLRALESFRRALNPPPFAQKAEREPITLTPAEIVTSFKDSDLNTAHFKSLFLDHPMLDVFYEEMSEDLQGTFDAAQTFLGVDRRKLRIANRRQNPEPLGELIANYDELRREFKDHPYAWMFED